MLSLLQDELLVAKMDELSETPGKFEILGSILGRTASIVQRRWHQIKGMTSRDQPPLSSSEGAGGASVSSASSSTSNVRAGVVKATRSGVQQR